MDVVAGGSRPSRKVGRPSFTGTVWQDPIIRAPEPAILRAAWVRFEPGARQMRWLEPVTGEQHEAKVGQLPRAAIRTGQHVSRRRDDRESAPRREQNP